jgi:hypothetical protein
LRWSTMTQTPRWSAVDGPIGVNKFEGCRSVCLFMPRRQMSNNERLKALVTTDVVATNVQSLWRLSCFIPATTPRWK